PEDVKGAAVFLASPASNYVNGYTIAVDGGWLAR
ncbi:MAG: SDR family oxidoreductase, partial [Rectinema sp.]